MTTKYGFSDIREALVKDLKGAYPTKWEDFEPAKVLGENVFGSPEPHPNAVLNLFLEQRIKFALPFAACRAGLRRTFCSCQQKTRNGAPTSHTRLYHPRHGKNAMDDNIRCAESCIHLGFGSLL